MQLGCVDQGLGLALGSFHKYCFCGSRFLDMTIRAGRQALREYIYELYRGPRRKSECLEILRRPLFCQILRT